MSDRVNKTYPYQSEGVNIGSPIDELMFKYYRVDGVLHEQAYEVGQQLQLYFITYACSTMNQSLKEQKMTMPSMELLVMGLEAPFTLMIDNVFYQNNFTAITTAVLTEVARMNTARNLSEEDRVINYSLNLTKNEYLTVIAGLVAGTKIQRAFDMELRLLMASQLDILMKNMKQAMSDQANQPNQANSGSQPRVN